MTILRFTITLRSHGTADPVVPDEPVPGAQLKAVMRASAVELLGSDDHAVIREVFDTGAWAWSDAQPMAASNGSGPSSRFSVALVGDLDRLSEADHVLVLRCSAGGAYGLGAGRRSALGWVAVTPDDGPVSEREIDRLLALRG
jgi:hypothetical protein